MTFAVVDRPFERQQRSGAYAELYQHLLVTVTTGKALKVGLTRIQCTNLQGTFRRRYPHLRLVTRTLPDGCYAWAEPRVGSAAVSAPEAGPCLGDAADVPSRRAPDIHEATHV